MWITQGWFNINFYISEHEQGKENISISENVSIWIDTNNDKIQHLFKNKTVTTLEIGTPSTW